MSAKILKAVLVATLLALMLSIGAPAQAVEPPAMLAGPGSSTASG
jgi:hypothetical protein